MINDLIDFENFKATMSSCQKGKITKNEKFDINLGNQTEDKFFELLAEERNPKHKWRKCYELGGKPGQFYSGNIYQKPSIDAPTDTIWMEIRFLNTSISQYLELLDNFKSLYKDFQFKKFR